MPKVIPIYDELSYAKNMEHVGFRNGCINIRELCVYAKWLKYIGKNDMQIKYDLIEFSKRYDKNFNEIIHARILKTALSNTKKNTLRVPIETNITQNELYVINAMPTLEHRKILFTMLVIAKYMKNNNTTIYSKKQKEKIEEKKAKKIEEFKKDGRIYKEEYFCNQSIKDIMEQACVRVSTKERTEIMHELTMLGALETTQFGTSRIPFIDHKGISAIKVCDYKTIGLQYERHENPKSIIKCDICGVLSIRKSKKHKYCINCAKNIKLENDRKRIANKRNNK